MMYNNTLFEAKDMYLMSCTPTGKLQAHESLSYHKRRMMEFNNMHLMDGMEFSDVNDFPILKAYNGSVNLDFHPFSEHNKLDGKGQAIHFFAHDYKFATACDKKLEATTYKLSKFDCLFTPDYSLFVDVPSHINKHSVYLSRFAGAHWQNCGFNVIPTASWGNADSFEYCFEGLPTNSVIGVCGVGVQWSRSACLLWQYAMRTLEERLTPSLVIVYGIETEIPGFQTPIIYIEDQIAKFYRK